ncbi:NUDIX hydrolase [Nitrosomonas sp. Nm33]|uniref:NUDIX hydrolase n=1 Tax=Nitrosomonas sp. Nm33 TaxID=133724 RepID=UPI000898BE9F|nr:NUDIX hydrolase [Nitrosomonas sp. Nm33]SDY66400.1 ADP-ribose pyrophosphatase YjhB, NUDIX family [Nitrosomonas sp. Nm33]
MIWKPNVTVAAVIEQNGKYLLVEEDQQEQGVQLNQPAGHLEAGESIIQASVREVLEETAYTFIPQWLIGIYNWHSCAADTTFLRFALSGIVTDFDPNRTLDSGILRAAWFDLNEIRERRSCHRSPLVMQCIEDYLAGKRYPLEIFTHYD